MRTSQGECGLLMIERSRRPGCGDMAHLAILRETCLDVVGAGGLVEVRQVAAHALGRHRSEVVVHMADQTQSGHVGASQRECRLVVVEVRRLPCGSGVAYVTSLREPRLDVVWVCSLGEVRHVAARTIHGRSSEFVVDVALRALQRNVGPGQRELRGSVVIESCPIPVDRRVAQ